MNLKNDFLRIFSTLTFLVMLNIGIAQTNYTIEYQLENGKKIRATYKDLAWGIEDEEGNQLLPNEYDNLYTMQAPFGEKLSVKGKVISGVHKIDQPILPYFWLSKDGMEGLLFVENGSIIPTVYDDILLYWKYKYPKRFSNKEFVYCGFKVICNGFYGFYDNNGKLIIPVLFGEFDDIETDNDYYILQKGNFQGAANEQGEIIIQPTEYTKVTSLTDGNLCVIKDGKAGVCDSTGQLLFITKYTDIDKVHNGEYYTVLGKTDSYGESGPNHGIIKKDGTIIKEPTLDMNDLRQNSDISMKNYFIRCDEKGLYGVYYNNKFIIPCIYERISKFPMIDYFCVEKDGCQGVIDNKGKVIIPIGIYHKIKNESVSYFDSNHHYITEIVFEVSICEKKGLIATDGKIIVPADTYTFIKAKPDDYGNRRVRCGRFEGIIDKNNRPIILPNHYTNVHPAVNKNYYQVEYNEQAGICNKYGKEIVPPLYLAIIFHGGYEYFGVQDGNKYGLYTPEGNLVLPPIYSKINISEGKIIAWKDGVKHTFDVANELIMEQTKQSLYDDCFAEGDQYFDKKKYREAINSYKRALEYKKTEYVYYNIGVSHYNLKEYNDAIKCFEECISCNPPQSIANMAKNKIIESRRHLENRSNSQQQEAQAFYGGVLGFVSAILQAGNGYYAPNNNYFNSFAFFSNSQGQNYDYLLNPNYAIQQVEQQNQLEYYEFSQWCKKPDGSDYSYTEFMDMKVQAWQASQTSDGNTVNSSNSSTSTSSNPRQIEYYDKDCHLCHGSGKCSSCNGTHYMDYQFGPGKIECPNCKPNGACSACGGTGKIRSMRLN